MEALHRGLNAIPFNGLENKTKKWNIGILLFCKRLPGWFMVRFVIDQGKNEQMDEKNLYISPLRSRVNRSHGDRYAQLNGIAFSPVKILELLSARQVHHEKALSWRVISCAQDMMDAGPPSESETQVLPVTN